METKELESNAAGDGSGLAGASPAYHPHALSYFMDSMEEVISWKP